jgi:hypothetical protein
MDRNDDLAAAETAKETARQLTAENASLRKRVDELDILIIKVGGLEDDICKLEERIKFLELAHDKACNG